MNLSIKSFFSPRKQLNDIGRSLMSGIMPSFFMSGTPVWQNLAESAMQLDSYCNNPVVQAVINIKASAAANIKFKVKDLRTGDIIPLDEYDKDGGKLKELLSNPNPLQSTFEWKRQFEVYQAVFGNAISYASVPTGFENNFSYKDIVVINNLPSYLVAPVLTGKWLDAEKKNEIISKYVMRNGNGKDRDFSPNTIFHRNDINIQYDNDFVMGKSKLIALKMPITNIKIAYESRNVIGEKRGALGMITPDGKDANGTVPLTDNEKKDAQKALEQYGLMKNQWQHMLTNAPLKFQKMAMNIGELKLFEEIESDAIAVANAYGVPELLVKYYITSGTFANLDASEKRLYTSTIIPESKDFVIGLNRFLNTKSEGIELIGSFDHVAALQINRKEEAITNSFNEKSALSAFKIGGITYNQYLERSDLPLNDTYGDKYIFDLKPEHRNIILGIKTTGTNE